MTSTTTRVWVALFVVAVFACGLAAGTLVAPRVGSGAFPGVDGPRRGGRPSEGGGPRGSRFQERVAEELDLTETQRAEMEELFSSRRVRFREINEEMRARFETEQAGMRAALEDILTAEQIERFDERILRFGDGRRSRPGERGRFGPRGGPDGSRPDRSPR